MTDIKTVGDEHRWRLAMMDLANGDSREAVAALREDGFQFSAAMRAQLAEFISVWPPKRPPIRPRRLTSKQRDRLKAIAFFQRHVTAYMRRNAQEIAAEHRVEPSEVIAEAARLRREAKAVWAIELGITVSTLEAMLKRERVKRKGIKYRT